MMAVRLPGRVPLVRRPDGLIELPAGWTRALVKTTANETGMRVHEIEPDPDGRTTFTNFGFWIAGAFKVTTTVRSSYLAPRAWKSMGPKRP